MDYVKLGNTGTKISKLILGTMQFGWRVSEEESFQVMDKALELGINCFDTADIYSSWGENSYPGKSEEIIGKWMKDRGVRDEIVLATKLLGKMSEDINDKGLSRRHVRQAISGSLKRLQTDWIDLYQIHSFDVDTPIEETLHALNVLIDNGEVNYIGASNIQPWKFIESLWRSESLGLQRFETFQPPYNLARRYLVEHSFVDIHQKYNIGIIPYSPLGGGFLTGRYKKGEVLPDTPRNKGVVSRYFKERNWIVLDRLMEIAKNHDITLTQVALAWVLSREFINAPIIGANSIDQLVENVGALDVKLTNDELSSLTSLSDWIDSYESIR